MKVSIDTLREVLDMPNASRQVVRATARHVAKVEKAHDRVARRIAVRAAKGLTALPRGIVNQPYPGQEQS